MRMVQALVPYSRFPRNLLKQARLGNQTALVTDPPSSQLRQSPGLASAASASGIGQSGVECVGVHRLR